MKTTLVSLLALAFLSCNHSETIENKVNDASIIIKKPKDKVVKFQKTSKSVTKSYTPERSFCIYNDGIRIYYCEVPKGSNLKDSKCETTYPSDHPENWKLKVGLYLCKGKLATPLDWQEVAKNCNNESYSADAQVALKNQGKICNIPDSSKFGYVAQLY